jgi:DNA-binding LacI/PurR family transcriptional regulator
MARKKNSQKVTIKDVARAAGVSTQTVSRVINNRPDVSSETRARIEELIDELGYAPNIIARSLSRGRSNTLGVIGFGLEYYGTTSVLRGIEHKSHELGFSIILSLLDDYEIKRVDRILQDLLSRQVEGIIWAIPGIGKTLQGLSEKFADANIPVVFLNKDQTEENAVVAMDSRLGGQLATTHLLEQGYRKIGIITGPADWWEARQREMGWRETLRDNGVNHLETLKAEGDWSPASGEKALHILLDRVPDLDAVFVSNDQMALGVLQAARQLGISVPGELGVVGFDDIPEAEYFYPRLTTVRQNTRKLGGLAVEKLYKFIKANHDNRTISMDTSWVQPRLVVRDSSARSRRSGRES